MNERIDDITIVGGGAAGWLMGLFLTTMLNKGESKVKVTLIESPNIPTIGVGEGTVTGFPRLLQQLGIKESEFLRKSDATFKCAGKFVGWNLDAQGKPTTFYNPFNVGGYVGGFETGYYYQKYGNAPGASSFVDSIMPTQMVVENQLGPKLIGAKDYESPVPYTYHLHAHDFSRQIANIAKKRGVVHILDEMVDAEQDENGYITALNLKEKGRVPVKLVIDCTGFRGRILQQVLKEPYNEFGNHLLCDRAIPIPHPHEDPKRLTPCTTATAMKAGWTFDVPLYSRMGTGYVYSSRFISDDEALDELIRHIGDESLRERTPPVIKMRVGRVRNTWVKNVIATGLSAGFVEPLEASAIYTIEMTARMLLTYYPEQGIEQKTVDRFNEVMNRMYNEILSFIVMTYYTSNRTEPFWVAAREDIDLPDRLRENLEMWQSFMPSPHDVEGKFLFSHWNYIYVLLGKGYFEGRHFPAERFLVKSDWTRFSNHIAEVKRQMKQQLPSHYDLLKAIRSGR
ncbi:tryptophan halogenase family protein [endosymbiont of Lamellibrachia barhami]|uniref:tryptophan halogenase family protein n=1 Tax=endosymbiont of Lamellibrachia barhami TaxID=205975 RepID=UPI0015A82709|nr:tryptophan halogenase family protein [endosymbiont of Lamellibrachia barhami]